MEFSSKCMIIIIIILLGILGCRYYLVHTYIRNNFKAKFFYSILGVHHLTLALSIFMISFTIFWIHSIIPMINEAFSNIESVKMTRNFNGHRISLRFLKSNVSELYYYIDKYFYNSGMTYAIYGFIALFLILSYLWIGGYCINHNNNIDLCIDSEKFFTKICKILFNYVFTIIFTTILTVLSTIISLDNSVVGLLTSESIIDKLLYIVPLVIMFAFFIDSFLIAFPKRYSSNYYGWKDVQNSIHSAYNEKH